MFSNFRHRFLIAEQLEEIGPPASIVLEPVGRNTAPAACIAALIGARTDANALVLLAPSDHMIADPTPLPRRSKMGSPGAAEEGLVTFGVEPDCPHTGYGYIETDNATARAPGQAIRGEAVAGGRRSLSRQRSLLLERRHLPVQGRDPARALQTHAPNILACLPPALDERPRISNSCAQRSLRQCARNLARLRRRREGRQHACVPLPAPWSDVGSWSALWDIMEKDVAAMSCRATAEIT